MLDVLQCFNDVSTQKCLASIMLSITMLLILYLSRKLIGFQLTITSNFSTRVESAHVMSILAKSKFKGLDSRLGKSNIEKCLRELNRAQETKKILEALRFSSYVNIVFDFDRNDLESLASSDALGWYSDTEKELLIGAKDVLLSSNRNDFLGVFAHELAHWCMQLVFKNNGKPYYQSDPRKVKSREFEEIVEKVHKDFKNIPYETIQECFECYHESEWDRELIVRVPHLIAQFGTKKTEEILSHRESTKLLLKFYRSHVMDEVDKFIEEGDLEATRKAVYKLNIKFGLLRRYMKYDLEFCSYDDIDPPGSTSNLVYVSSHPFLTFLKIARTMNHDEPSNKFYATNLFCSFQMFAEKCQKITKRFRYLYKTLFVVCSGAESEQLSDYKDWLHDLYELSSIPGKRVILFIDIELLQSTKTLLVNSKFINLSNRKLDIHDLDKSSQQRLLEFPVTFLGKQVKLQDLVRTDELELVDGNLINRLLNEEIITVGSEVNCAGNRLPGFVTYYENLTVERLINFLYESMKRRDIVILVGEPENYPEQMKRTLIELFGVHNVEELYVSLVDLTSINEENRQLIERRVLLVHSRFDYNYSHIIDLLENYSYLVGYIIHIESEETIYSDLMYTRSLKLERKLLLKTQKCEDEGIDENEFIDSLLKGDHRVFVLSDEPGSGKSHSLNYIQHLLNSDGRHVMKFALRECTSFIDKHTLEKDLKVEDALRFLYTLCEIDKFGEKLFSSKIKKNSKSPTTLLLDGFDEIGSSDLNDSFLNKEKISHLIKCLERYTNVYVVITTRPDSESYLPNQPVFKFKPLKSEDRMNYINTFCRTRVRLQRFSGELLPLLPNKSTSEPFTNSPLHITMTSEMLLEKFKQCKPLKFPVDDPLFWNPLIFQYPSLNELYSGFVNMKYRTYFKEKKNSPVDNRTKENCESAFRKLALFSLFGNEEFTKGCFSNDSMFQRDSEGIVVLNTDKVREYYDVGMISHFSRSSIDFIHRTFAEYFVSKLFISWLHDENLSKISIMAIASKHLIKYSQDFSVVVNFFYVGGENLFTFINVMISSEQFTRDILKAHHSTMHNLGVDETTQALSLHLSSGHYNIASHIMKCWTEVRKFHELLYYPTTHEHSLLPYQKQMVASRYLSEEFMQGLAEKEGLFRMCMKCFCVIHEHGVPEMLTSSCRYLRHCRGLLDSGKVEAIEGLIQAMVQNKLIAPENKVGKWMHLAVLSGNKSMVEWMEEMGGDVFSKTEGGTSTLAYAIRMGEYRMAEWLQKRGVKIRDRNENQDSHVLNEAWVSVSLSEYLINRLFDLGFIKNRINMDENGGNGNSLLLAMGEPWDYVDTLKLLQTFTKLGSNVSICDLKGIDTLQSVAGTGNHPEFLEWVSSHRQFEYANGMPKRNSSVHATIKLDFMFKPAPNVLAPKTSSQVAGRNPFFCHAHLPQEGEDWMTCMNVRTNIDLRNEQNINHKKFNDKFHDMELDGILGLRADNPNDIQLIFSKYKNSVLRLLEIMAKSREANEIGVLTVCGRVQC